MSVFSPSLKRRLEGSKMCGIGRAAEVIIDYAADRGGIQLRRSLPWIAGVECSAPTRSGVCVRPAGISHLKGQEVFGGKIIVARQGHISAFTDESALSDRVRCEQTRAPKIEAAVLQYDLSAKQLPVIAGIGRWP